MHFSMAAAFHPHFSSDSVINRHHHTTLQPSRSHTICPCFPLLASPITIFRENFLISPHQVNRLFVQSELSLLAESQCVPDFELPKRHRLPTNNEVSGAHNGVLLAGDSFCYRRRTVAWLLFSSALLLSHSKAEADEAAADDNPAWSLNLESYTDRTEGFSLLKPVQWSKVDKAGATVLFEDPKSKGNNLGVVVNPVRISSLSEFGTPDSVAGKLLKAEMKKPSTNNVELINVKERQVLGAVPLYQLEYKLDSTRGAKRIFSAVTVASKKLYILNIAFVDSPEKPLSPKVASVLDHIVESFDLLN